MDILIFGGQSNMQGQTEALIGTEPVCNAWEYKFLSDSLAPLKNPVGENIRTDLTEGYLFTADTDQQQWLTDHALGAACYGHTNMVPEFCRAYREITGHEVIAVHAAKGSTMVHEWLPGTDGYRALTAKASAAIQKAEHPGRIFFIWLQGESDAIFETTKAQYMERCTALCDALKADLGIERFGIIRVGRFTNDSRDLEIMAAQDALCRETEDFLMLTDAAVTLNVIPEAMNPYVGGHYSARGLELLGRAAATTLGLYVR